MNLKFYQVIETSTGDMGLGKFRMNDIEAGPSPRIARRTAARPCTTGRPGGRTSATGVATEGAVRAHAQQYRTCEPEDPCRCSKITRLRTAASAFQAMQQLMGREFL